MVRQNFFTSTHLPTPDDRFVINRFIGNFVVIEPISQSVSILAAWSPRPLHAVLLSV
jgi:hypothetical protein